MIRSLKSLSSLPLAFAALMVACPFQALQAGASIPNDDFAAATVISGATGSTAGDTTNATQQVDDPEFLKSEGNGTSIWWRWTAPVSGRFVFDTIGSDRDTILGVYEGSAFADLTPVAEADDGVSDTNESRLRFTATAGTEYFIAVDTFTGAPSGPVTLNWAPFVPPALTAPVMVYSLRSVNTSQGLIGFVDSEAVYFPRSTMVSTAWVVRGRSTDALVTDDDQEAGPVAVIEFYTMRLGSRLEKYYTIARGTPDPGDTQTLLPLGMSSSLARVSRASTGVFETASIEAERDGSEKSVRQLKGRATLTKIHPSQAAPLWFARRLTASVDGYQVFNEDDSWVQGQPEPGIYNKDSHTLTFSATETNAVTGLSFNDAVARVVQRLEARGYQPADDTIDVP